MTIYVLMLCGILINHDPMDPKECRWIEMPLFYYEKGWCETEGMGYAIAYNTKFKCDDRVLQQWRFEGKPTG